MWATGLHKVKRNSDGFTLIEVLVVLMVIALVGSVIALSVDSGARSYQQQAANRLFRAIADQAKEEAELTGLDHGLLIQPKIDQSGRQLFQYQWRRRTQPPLYEFFKEDIGADSEFAADGGRQLARPEWEVTDDVLYLPRELPSGLLVRMSIDDVPVDFRRLTRDTQNDERRDDGKKDIKPQVIFYASGEATPATIEFIEEELEESLWRYQWDLFGQLEVEIAGELEGSDGV
jgi:general secretion pathway protein H